MLSRPSVGYYPDAVSAHVEPIQEKRTRNIACTERKSPEGRVFPHEPSGLPNGSNLPTVQRLGRWCGWGRPLGDGLGDE
jgi:hypothetical protein